MKSRLALLLFVAPAVAQDLERPDPQKLLNDAVLHFKQAPELVLKAKVKHQEPREKNAGAGNVVVQVIGPGSGAGEPFEGEVQVWRDPDGVRVITSTGALPGFAMYIGERTVREVTFDDEPFALDRLETELATLMVPERFAKYVLDARLEPTVDDQTGDVVFRGELPRRTVRRAKPVGPGMPRERVIKVEATLRVTKEGRFRSITVAVVHSDPLAEMLEGRRGQIGLGPAPAPKNDDDHEVEGVTSTYTLEFGRIAPSKRSIAFKNRINELLEAK